MNEWKYVYFIQISLKYVANVPNNNKPSSVETVAWRRPGDKKLSETVLA